MSTDPSPPRTSSWVWYFVGIALIAIALLTILGLFIRNQLDPDAQFKKENLQIARRLWEAKGSKDYQMLYTVQRGGDRNKDRFFVEVHGGKVSSVVLNGNQTLPPDQFEYHSMTGLFNSIEIFLNRDAQPGSPPSICRGYFDGDDGHLLLFSRQVPDTRERVEIKMEEYKPLSAK